MEAKRTVEIAKSVVTFFVKNKNNEIKVNFKKAIKFFIIELGPYLENEDFLCNEYTAMMIVHALPGIPIEKEYLDDLLGTINCSLDEFVEWIAQVQSNQRNGICFHLKNIHDPHHFHS